MYFSEMDYQRRIGVYLGHDRPKYQCNHKALSYANTSSGNFNIPISKTPYFTSPQFQSWFWLKGEGIALEIFEQTKKAQREYTRKYLSDVCGELEQLEDISINDSIIHLLAPGSSIHGENNTFEIIDGMQPGIYRATGFINAGIKGHIYIKAFDKESGNRLSKSRTMEKVEYPGWSPNLNEKFHYQFEFTIYEGDWSTKYPVTIELWFKPSNSKDEQKFAWKEMQINGWQR